MNVLIADDEPVSRRLLQVTLVKWGYDVVVANDGHAAWQTLQGDDPPLLAILDWIMPGLDGLELCRRVRQTPALRAIYLILLTSKDSRADIVEGLQAGANDYLTKPFDAAELQARLQVGERVVKLQIELAQRVAELEAALDQVKQLEGYLPICAYCKKIRDDENYWQQIEGYIEAHSEALFTHSVCPDCYRQYVEPELEILRQRKKSRDT
jgi:DNA-binding response OmpR family regulator